MKTKTKLNTVTVIFRSFTLCRKILPRALAVLCLSLVCAGAANGMDVVVGRMLFESIEQSAGQERLLMTAIVSIGLYILIRILCSLASWLRECCQIRFASRLDVELGGIYNQKLSRLSAVEFEDKSRLDFIERAESGMMCIGSLVSALVSLVCYHLVYFVILGVFLYQIDVSLGAAILLVFLPTAIAQFVQVRYYSDEEEKLAPLRRLEDSFYYAAMDTRETRLFGLFEHFKNLRLDAMKKVFDIQYKTEKKISLMRFVLNLVKVFGWIGILSLLFLNLSRGSISVGAFAAVFVSIGTMFSMTEELMRVYHNGITANIGAAANFLALMENDEPTHNSKADNDEVGIRFSHVSFSYPSAERPAVSDVSFTVAPGESIAIVGENGSGKTTLSKLLCGLYVPSEGSVIVDGTDTRYAERESLFAKFSAVFQSFNDYGALTLRDNVRISDFDSERGVDSCLKEAEIDCDDRDTFPSGQDTYMSREFDGVDVSRGQWQRIAMARGDYRDKQYFILDEPTAAIDPLEEARVYKKYARSTELCTTIFITHRMASARIADRIIVMDNGRIVESGTHDSLIAAGGKYYELWSAQSRGYAL